MRRILLAVTVLGTLLFSGDAICEEEKAPPASTAPADQPHNVWMKMKLKYGQNIYTSIAQADIEAISLDAKRLRALNWFEGIAHGKDEVYQEQLQVFQLANDRLIASAEKKNLDGCTLAFMQMTFSCTACHQRMRDASKAPRPAKAP